jgi:hypothetical protein
MPPRPRTDPSPWRGGVLPETGRHPGHGQSGVNRCQWVGERPTFAAFLNGFAVVYIGLAGRHDVAMTLAHLRVAGVAEQDFS